MGLTADDVVRELALEPHPEGGFFRETYRSDMLVTTERGVRAAATAILFLVSTAQASRFHRLTSDELWLHHGGAPLELVILRPDGQVERETLTRADEALAAETATPQAVVPAGAWQAARVLPGSDAGWALVTCVVTPGFDYEDFELADRHELAVAYPGAEELIEALT